MPTGSRWYENPREVGEQYVDENNETSYGGLVYGRIYFADLDTMKTRDFIKGGNAVFTLSFHGRLTKFSFNLRHITFDHIL